MSRQGSVKKDESGNWCFVVDTVAPGGRRRQVRRRGFSTKAEANDALTDLLSELRDGSFVEPKKVTVGTYLRAWLDGLATAGRRPSTIASYRRTLASYLLEDDLAGVPLQGLQAVELDRLYSKLATSGKRDGTGLSLRTVRYVHSIVGKALADAERKGLVNRNVARLASPPATSSTRAPEMTAWTPAELRAFLDSVADHHHGALYRLAAMTGLRRAEVCGLRWADVDLDGGMLRVRQTITSVQEPTGADEGPKTRRTLVVGDTKTARSRRTLDLDGGTVSTLRTHRTEQLEQRMLMGAGWTDHGLVFAMPDGQPWNPDVLTRGFDRLVRASDLPRIRLHDLRHTHASHLLAAGVNVKVVSDRLGHASVAFTLDVYGHVLPGQQADAAAKVAAMVDGAGLS